VAVHGDVDQDALALALGRTPTCSFQGIPAVYCATNGDRVAEPIILHDSASASVRKIGGMTRRLHYRVGRWLAHWRRSPA
jgi:hypothetical protein